VRLELHERQSLAFESPATEILYGGAAGGGKSHLMRVAAIAWGVAIPGLQVYIFRRTSPDLFKNHMEGPTGFPALLGEWVERGCAGINYSKNYIDLPGGSRVHLCHCQYEKDVYKYQGAEIHVLMFDELTHFSPTQYRFLRSRVRIPDALPVPKEFKGSIPRILAASNPGGPGHNWVKASWVDAAQPMEVWRAADAEGGMLRQFIPALLSDNPSISEEDYGKSLEGLGRPDLVRAMLDGDWDIVAGGMVDDVWDRARHVLEPFEIPASWRIDRSFDWGSSKPFSVGWWAESDGTEAVMADGTRRNFPPGTLFRIAEWYGCRPGAANEGLKLLAVEVARGILEREQIHPWGKRVKTGPADSSIFDVESGRSVADDMERAGVRWERADKSSGSRRAGAEEIRKRLKAGLSHPMEDAGLFVFSTCRDWIRTVPVIPRDDKKPDDVDTDAEDHTWDETRYRCRAVEPGRGYTLRLR